IDDSPEIIDDSPEIIDDSPEIIDDSPEIIDDSPDIVVDDSDIAVGEDFTSELTRETEYETTIEGEKYSDEIAKILTDADVYVRYGLHQKAIEHLRHIFDLDPGNIEAREQLKEILLNQGREQEAIEELMRLAELTATREPIRAEIYLREILTIHGTYQPAFQLAERFRLSLTGSHEIEIVESSDRDGVADGGIAPIEDALDFDDIPYGTDEPSGVALGQAGRAVNSGPEQYRFLLDNGDSTDTEERQPDPSAVTMELSMDEVESVLEIVGEGSNSRDYDQSSVDATPAADGSFPYDQPTQFSDPLQFGGGAQFHPGPEFDLPQPFEEPVFDPVDAAEFDRERESAAREFKQNPQLGYAAPAQVEFSASDLDAEPVADIGDYAVDLDASTDRSGSHNFLISDTELIETPPHELVHHAGDDNMPHIRPQADDTKNLSIETVDTGIDVLDEQIVGAPRPGGDASGLEDDLDEADFFVSQRLYDEARDILGGLLHKYPEHPLILAKLEEIDELQQAAANSAVHGTYGSQAGPMPSPMPSSLPALGSESAEPFEPDFLDSGALSGDLSNPRLTVLLENPPDDEDADTHYDLGLAYKEMGLYEDAVKAFKKVLPIPGREVQCRLMIGLCLREQSKLSEAIHQFKAGLHAPEIAEEEQLSLYYEIAVSYERIEDPKEALYFYELIQKRKHEYRDIPTRIAAIRHALEQSNSQAISDDAEAAIDSLLAETENSGRRSG
ncbi:MAG: tetratricopeptide repeat protein, partial [Proteobacteria bacterium]|nr:tetratricopeptide repeat protein [Pseudomonadota bacterium]